MRAIFITQRQMKPKILHTVQAKPGQCLKYCRPDTAKCRCRQFAWIVRRCRGGVEFRSSHPYKT
jgi:hypothetical protein